MSQPEEGFFSTQIAQKGEVQPEEPKAEEEHPTSPLKSEEHQEEEDLLSLKELLTAFNSHDKEEKGLISVDNIAEILESKSIPASNGTYRCMQSRSITR